MTHSAPTTAPVWWPNQRAWRTALQVIASGILSLATLIAGLAVFAPQFVAALEPILPAEWYVWLLGVVAFIGLLSAALARIMAIPGVNDWLIRHSGFGTAPRGQLASKTPDAERSCNCRHTGCGESCRCGASCDSCTHPAADPIESHHN